MVAWPDIYSNRAIWQKRPLAAIIWTKVPLYPLRPHLLSGGCWPPAGSWFVLVCGAKLWPLGVVLFFCWLLFSRYKKTKTLGFVWQCFCREWFNSWLPLPVWQRNKRNTARRISGLASKVGGINLSRQGDTLTNTDLSIEQRDFYELPDSRTFFSSFFFNCLWVITFRPQVPLLIKTTWLYSQLSLKGIKSLNKLWL